MEERVSHCEWDSHCAEASEQPTPPIVHCRKIRSQKAKAEETAPPETGPLKGREKKWLLFSPSFSLFLTLTDLTWTSSVP